VPDYATVNRAAITEMHRQVGDLQLDAGGIATRGLVVRHLILPDGLSGSRGIFEFLAREISPATCVSLMSQYFPAHKAVGHSVLGRRITRAEYAAAQADFSEAGLAEGFQQDFE
jgi:putative pyruvate formate lyase activating enzyme